MLGMTARNPEGTMSRDIRPRRRQEDWAPSAFDDSSTPDSPVAPAHGSEAFQSWRDAWHVSPSRSRHQSPGDPKKQTAPFRETLFDIHPDEDQDPERWDGLS
jgi:hypothetical protein